MKKLLFIAVVLSLLLGSSASAQRNRGYTYYEVQVVDDNGKKVTDINEVYIYAPDTTTQQTIYSDRGLQNQITQPMTTASTNTTLSNGHFTWWGPASGYDFRIGNDTVTASNASTATRTASDGQIVFPYYLQTISSSSYTDAQSITLGTDSDWVIAGGAVANRLTMEPAIDGATLYIGDGTDDADIRIFGGSTAVYAEFNEGDAELDMIGYDIQLNDDAYLYFGTDKDVSIKFDNAGDDLDILADDSEIALGADGAGPDVYWHTETAGDNVFFDEDTAEILMTDVDLQLDDDALVRLGSAAAGDVTLQFDGTNFEVFAAAADTPLALGGTAEGFDVTYAFETAGQFRTDYDGDFVNLTDDMDLRFGTGASSDGDFQISSSSGNVLTIGQVVSGTGEIAIGVDNKGLDTTFYAETASDYMKWDQDGSTNGALVFEDSSVHMMDDTTIIFGDGSDATIMYDEDGQDVLQITGAIGGYRMKTENVTADDVLTLTTDLSGKVFVVDGNTVTVKLTLPSVGATEDGWLYTFVDANEVAASDVQLVPADSDKINGTAGNFSSDGADELPCAVTLMYNHSNTDWTVVSYDCLTTAWDSD